MLDNVARENTEGLAIVAELEAKQTEMQAVLQSAIGAKHAVPKDTVFPHLHALGTLHTVLLEEMRVLEARERAAGELLTWRQVSTAELSRRKRRGELKCFTGSED